MTKINNKGSNSKTKNKKKNKTKQTTTTTKKNHKICKTKNFVKIVKIVKMSF